jgi:hypothetical protein
VRENCIIQAPPDHTIFKVNVDATFNLTTGEAAERIVAQDHEGQPHIMAWRLVGRCRDAEEAEALALLDGIRLAEH